MWETALNETPQQPGHVMHNMHLAAHDEYPYPGFYTVTDIQEAKRVASIFIIMGMMKMSTHLSENVEMEMR